VDSEHVLAGCCLMQQVIEGSNSLHSIESLLNILYAAH
jgi:hypothetical protein